MGWNGIQKFEEIKTGTVQELTEYFSSHVLKGEIVLLIAGNESAGNDVDLDIYSNIIKGFLLDLGAKYLENSDTMYNYEVIVRSVDFTNLKASELSGLVNATSMLETFGKTFGRYEKRKNESK